MRFFHLAIATGLLLVAAMGCGPVGTPQASGPTPVPAPVAVTFMAGFKPQANLPFVAAYMADSLGYFRDEGLEVTIQHSQGSSEHIPLLAAGRIQFGTATAADLVRRVDDPGLPLQAIALFGQRSDQAFASLPGSGIRTPKDWEGKIVGYKGTPGGEYLALLRAQGVDRSTIREVSVGFDPRILLEGRVDVFPVFESNEPWLMRQQGVDPVLIRPEDFGVQTMGLTYIVEREWLARNPDVAERFLRATLRGARYAIENPDAALAEVARRAPQENPEQQRFLFEVERANALAGLTSVSQVGSMTPLEWQALIDLLREVGLVSRPLTVADVAAFGPLERALAR